MDRSNRIPEKAQIYKIVQVSSSLTWHLLKIAANKEKCDIQY